MKKRLTAMLVSISAIVGLGAAPALAWDYSLSGSGQCQPDGSYKITWTVDNSTENEALSVSSSSNTAVVPVGTSVAAHQTAAYTETESGTTPGTFNLTLDVNWPSDSGSHIKTANVTLSTACTQPTPPPKQHHPTTGGRGGGGSVTTTSTPPQVVVPVAAAVNAGAGGATQTINPLAISGLLGSVAAVAGGVGLRRFKRPGANS
jgi:hypothetical protein